MSFERQPTEKWRREIPGTRWFKADLHVHTIDDHLGGRARMPDGISGNPRDPHVLSLYARRFLQGVVASGVQVVGLTPHSPRVGDDPGTSAVWKIVEEWNHENDEDGVPFREKIFAVFPGFEPNVNNGGSGVHLLFLFDPEIGRDRYLRLFDAIMDGRCPWDGGRLRLTPRDATEIFRTIDQHQEETRNSDASWNSIVLAPHFRAEHGLLRELRAQVLETFPCDRLLAYELRDSQLPEEFTTASKPGSFLLPFMEKHRQAFFHGSDAYSIEKIGIRHTWLKLASSRIEALRQAFIAIDSRMRIGFIREANGGLTEIPGPPDVSLNNRPWLKSVTVRGGASFFGGNENGRPRETHFDLSPDLTCIIGGSMTGKSTLLDGLRTYVGAPAPADKAISEQVKARGKHRFLSGSPEIEIKVPGSDPTATLHERWPARFFAQSELQRLAETGSIGDLLAKLAPTEVSEIEERKATLRGLDRQLSDKAKSLPELDGKLAEAEQDHNRAQQAKQQLDAFEGAGVSRLHTLGRDRQNWRAASREGIRVGLAIDRALASARSLVTPEIGDELARVLTESGIDPAQFGPDGRRSRIIEHLQSARDELKAWTNDVATTVETLKRHESTLQTEVERALAKLGLESSKLMEFQKLNRQAALLTSYEANYRETRTRVETAEHSFATLQRQRHDLVQKQREAFDRVLAYVKQQFGNRIRARRIENGDLRSLNKFLAELSQRGVTRWWNGLEPDDRPAPKELLDHLAGNTLDDVGMTSAVQRTFRESLTKSKRRELAALRAPDIYVLEMCLNDGSYRQLDKLSGGQKVSVLLSLLLETADNRPLVIDQPEDELDNRFLWGTILPALKKLKGQRQIIVATHNPNIVVNGDADMVIQLEATAQRGAIAEAGAIEEPAVRDAIVRTVDGGDEAFRLRRHKYGF